MTYNEFIQNILDTRGRFGIPEGEYKERHHITPKCMGGTDEKENLIDLYAREHFIAHKLLMEENPDNIKLVRAFIMMIPNCRGNRDIEFTAEDYQIIREAYSKSNSELHKGKSSWLKGLTKETDPRVALISQRTSKYRKENKIISWNKGLDLSNDPRISNFVSAASHPGETNGMYGKHHTDAAKEKIGKAASERMLGKKIHLGYKDSPETKAKKSSATKNGNNPRAIHVRCVETGEVFDCIKLANIKYNIGAGLINKCCKGELEIAGGYHWEYAK